MPDATTSPNPGADAPAAPNPHLAPYLARGLKGRIFSGVQPTGNLHLGNYLGAIRNFARLQSDYECIYCVVDQHAITLWQDPKELASQTREIASAFLCAELGITQDTRADRAQYLAQWLKLMKSDSRAIFTAAAKASEAVAYLKRLQQPG